MSKQRWPSGFEWAEKMEKDLENQSFKSKEQPVKLSRKEKRRLKAKNKLDNPYGINDMSDSEFSAKYVKLMTKSVMGSSIGIVAFIFAILGVIWAISH